MRIAVSYQDGEIFPHFGRTEAFKLYEVEDGKVTGAQVAGTNGQGHGALAGVLASRQVDVLICGGIGGPAQEKVRAAGIRLCGGVSGSCDEAVAAFLSGTLSFDNEAADHHKNGGCCCHH